jgi:hypothetical protein
MSYGNCSNCHSPRLAYISAKCSDLFFIKVNNDEKHDYVPYNLGIGGGDYVQFTYCLQCGKIQDNVDDLQFPIPQEEVNKTLGIETEEE